MRATETPNKERKAIKRHFDLVVYQKALAVAQKIFTLSKSFLADERYSLTDQIRRSPQSVCANLAEAWRKRRYPAHGVSKLSDNEAEVAETQTWLQFADTCGYLEKKLATELFNAYEEVSAMLVAMINHPEKWQLK